MDDLGFLVCLERVPPADPFIRINFDTTFDQKEFRSSSGVIVKNERGEVLLTKSTLHGEVASSFVAETLACSQAVEVGQSLGVDMVKVKRDSLVVIRKRNSKENDRSKIRNIIKDIHQNK
uniref:RNase H type-1 domain-containing protein n=1 Tax=Gossypium raimondii TaxID=29730 RepID=A0A0D2SAW1_GOSRA|nr:hypothetical protein B456_013G088900 [Gossypium raimondii]